MRERDRNMFSVRKNYKSKKKSIESTDLMTALWTVAVHATRTRCARARVSSGTLEWSK